MEKDRDEGKVTVGLDSVGYTLERWEKVTMCFFICISFCCVYDSVRRR